ncbi:hypothetical protein ACIRO3_27720 [Streptomyces sp. NPDC102278]|uniref:hypothetical protein n=1 Tax=Streptomyces sp. NPDC102278 TaxID=3366152 RepID=UPI00382AF37C
MTHEAVPETPRQTLRIGQAAPDSARQESGAPKGLLQQMEELMAALNADLSRLDADLQCAPQRTGSDHGDHRDVATGPDGCGASAGPGGRATENHGASYRS